MARLVLDRPEAKNALTPEMRDDIVARVRRPGPTPTSGPCWSPGSATPSAPAWICGSRPWPGRGAPASTPATPVRHCAAACRPSSAALGAGQAHCRRRQRHRGGPGCATWPWPATSSWCASSRGSCGRSPAGGWWSTPGARTSFPRLVGLPRAKAMVMLGEGAKGEEAVSLGLAYRFVPAVDDLEWEANALAARLAAGPSGRSGLSKQLLNATFESGLTGVTRSVRPRPRPWPRSRRRWPRAWPPSPRSGARTSAPPGERTGPDRCRRVTRATR